MLSSQGHFNVVFWRLQLSMSLLRGGGQLVHYHWAQFVSVSNDITVLYLTCSVSSGYLKTKMEPQSVISYILLIQAMGSVTENTPLTILIHRHDPSYQINRFPQIVHTVGKVLTSQLCQMVGFSRSGM
jgi:hypothetical protein